MQAKKYRHIESGEKYNALFPLSDGRNTVIKKGASVNDTVKFIPKVVRETLYQTEKIAKVLKGNSTKESCHNIWDFVYTHIRYEKDEENAEQIRAPARAWHDRVRGVDCDCYTTFISSILSNLKIPHELRIAKYFKAYFQHIYPVAFDEQGKEIIIDCVVDQFNYEEPYSEIKNKTMDLEYLSGIDGNDEFGELGKVNILKKVDLSKTLNAVNKFNPVTALLRNGVLITMRINMFNVAQRLKWAYLSEADAKKRNIDIPKWKKLVDVKNKLENIHYGAGGKKEDLKKAILTGNGNKNKEVAGLLGYTAESEVYPLHENMPLHQLVGTEIYQSEKESIQGLGELGEPVTIAAVTAATAAIAAIAGIIKQIGNIFPKNDPKGAVDFQANTEADIAAAKAVQNTSTVTLNPTSSSPTAVSTTSSMVSTNQPPPMASSGAAVFTNDANTPINTQPADRTTTANAGFWEQNKKWLKPTLIGIGSLGILTALYKIFAAKRASPAIAGIGKRKNLPQGTSGGELGEGINPIELM